MKRKLFIMMSFVILMMGCAKIENNSLDTTPVGAINGLFTVNGHGDKVYFSQGNLQYQASTNTWRFAENQIDYVGGQFHHIWGEGYPIKEFGNVYDENGNKCDNLKASSTYEGWIDLFAWGTSGYDHGAVSYHPWDGDGYDSWYHAYGAPSCNLNDSIGTADWGYNRISNGGNSLNTWRTLTFEEWDFVFNVRRTSSGIRYAAAMVDGIDGLILLPDEWDANLFRLEQINSDECNYNVNVIVPSEWELLEQRGAVFLPVGGRISRDGYSSSNYTGHYAPYLNTNTGLSGNYWSATAYNAQSNSGYVTYKARCVGYSDEVRIGLTVIRSSRCSVRLVCSAN